VLDPDLIQKLNYGRLMGGKGEEMFSAIHACVWNRQEQITPRFKLLKINADFIGADWKLPQRYHVVYFDAFGPDKQPEMWGQDSFFRIYEGMEPGGVFVTYSAKGAVRRRLIVAGFDVQRISGPPGKKEMLRGIKLLSKVSMPKK